MASRQHSIERGATPRRGGIAPVKDVLAAYLREAGISGKLDGASVTRAWRDCAAPRYGQRARALRFADGELLVEVASAAHLQELQSFTGDELRRSANQRLGSERIRRVTYKLAR